MHFHASGVLVRMCFHAAGIRLRIRFHGNFAKHKMVEKVSCFAKSLLDQKKPKKLHFAKNNFLQIPYIHWFAKISLRSEKILSHFAK
jgi:hypothetical protein